MAAPLGLCCLLCCFAECLVMSPSVQRIIYILIFVVIITLTVSLEYGSKNKMICLLDVLWNVFICVC